MLRSDYITFPGFRSEYLIIVESEFEIFFKNIVTDVKVAGSIPAGVIGNFH